MISRRAFISGLAGSLLAAPLVAEPQQAGKIWRIGLLFLEDPLRQRGWGGFEQGLRELGYIEGRNLTFEYGPAYGKIDQLPGVARALVRLNVDLIVAFGASGAKAAKEATNTTPIVMLSVFDAVDSGLVASLARPGGNLTGMSFPYQELAAKRLELLKTAVPRLARVAIVTTGSRGGEVGALKAMTVAARSLGLTLEQYEVQGFRDVDRAFADMKAARIEAIAVSEAGELFAENSRIAALAIIHRFPTIGARQFAERGGLIAYGVNLFDAYRHTASYVDKILRGAKPSDLPIEQPTKFELVINLKTAKALGLTIPQSFLQRADEAIQ